MRKLKLLSMVGAIGLVMLACSTLTNSANTPTDVPQVVATLPDTLPDTSSNDTSGVDLTQCATASIDYGGYTYELPITNDTANLTLVLAWVNFDGAAIELATLEPGQGFTVTDAAVGDIYCLVDANTGSIALEAAVGNNVGNMSVIGVDDWVYSPRTDVNLVCNNPSVNLGGDPYSLILKNDTFNMQIQPNWVDYNGAFLALGDPLSPGGTFTVTDAMIGDFYCFTDATTGQVVSEVQVNGGIGEADVVDYDSWFFFTRDIAVCDAQSVDLGNAQGSLLLANDTADQNLTLNWASFDGGLVELKALAPGESYTVTDAAVGDVYCFTDTATGNAFAQIYVSNPMAEIYVDGFNSWIFYTNPQE